MAVARPLPVYATDQELYDALARRDDRAYAFLYTDTFPLFQNWILRNSGTEMDAEDAFHKGMISLMQNLETGKYTLQPGTRIRSVLFEYAKCVWISELRSSRVRTRSPMTDEIDIQSVDDVSRDLERFELVQMVRQSLQQLKDDCRKLIEWFYVEELSLREIAQKMGLKESSVKSKRYACAEKLKAIYQQAEKQSGV